MSEDQAEWATWRLECGHEAVGSADAERLYCAECMAMPGGGIGAGGHSRAVVPGSAVPMVPVSEDEPVSGEIVQAPPLADIRYEDEDPNRVTRVFVRVDWAGGKVREYEAADPQDFEINDPETDVSFQSMRMGVQSGGSPFMPMNMAVPNLRLSFRGNSRVPMLIRTERTAEPLERRPGLPG